jgi:hypothetical protein
VGGKLGSIGKNFIVFVGESSGWVGRSGGGTRECVWRWHVLSLGLVSGMVVQVFWGNGVKWFVFSERFLKIVANGFLGVGEFWGLFW